MIEAALNCVVRRFTAFTMCDYERRYARNSTRRRLFVPTRGKHFSRVGIFYNRNTSLVLNSLLPGHM